MTASATARRRRDQTPDSHLFPTRPYDLVKEFVIALAVVGLLTVLLAAVFSSPDRKALTLANWAKAAPADVIATATAELAGTSTSAQYGPPYNNNAAGQKLVRRAASNFTVWCGRIVVCEQSRWDCGMVIGTC